MGNKFVNKQHNNNKQKVNEGQFKLNLFEHNNNQVEQRNGGGFWNQNVLYSTKIDFIKHFHYSSFSTARQNLCEIGLITDMGLCLTILTVPAQRILFRSMIDIEIYSPPLWLFLTHMAAF